ncbi:hypothetical protein F1L20_26480 (plasmid) [Escherichia coli]|nr:hypothetical protein F1L20_26480 [Escherichia coli]
MLICQKCISDNCEHCNHLSGKCLFLCVFILIIWICGNDSNLLIVFYVQIMPDDFVMQLHRF